MTPFFAIVDITIREFIRSKVMLVLLLIGGFFVLFFACCGLGGDMELNNQVLAEQSQVGLFISLGFRVLSIFGALGSIFLGMNAVAGELQNKRAILILTRPISRITWLLGKTIGTWLVVAIDTTVLFVIAYALAAFKIKALLLAPFAGFGLLLFMLLALTLFVTTLSLVLPGIAAGFLGLVTLIVSWIMGLDFLQAYFFQITDYFEKPDSMMAQIMSQALTKAPSTVSQIVYWAMNIVVPHFGNVLDVAGSVAAGDPVGLSLDWWSLLALAIYSAVLVILGRYGLSRREF